MPDQTDTAPATWPALMSAPTLSRYLDQSERSVWRDVATGDLPPPVKLAGKTRWRRDDIDARIRELSEAPANGRK